MKTIYFVRHGESEENIEVDVFQGEASPLTKTGHEQGRFIGERAANLEFDLLVASPAQRAQETAQYISEKTGKTILTEALFTERKYPSSIIGKSRKDKTVVRLMDTWEKSFFDSKLRAEDGENFTDLKERTGKALEFLAARPEGRILVVAHGFLLRTIVARIIFGESLTEAEYEKVIQAFRTKNTGLTMIEHKPEYGGARGLPASDWTIRVWNDHAHLG